MQLAIESDGAGVNIAGTDGEPVVIRADLGGGTGGLGAIDAELAMKVSAPAKYLAGDFGRTGMVVAGADDGPVGVGADWGGGVAFSVVVIVA